MPLISCPQPAVLPIKTSDDSVSEDYGVLKNDKNVFSSLELRSQHMKWSERVDSGGSVHARVRKHQFSSDCVLWGGLKRETEKRGTVQNARSENARLENAASHCRTGKRGKRHVWKAKWCTTHVVFNRILDTVFEPDSAAVSPLQLTSGV